MKNNSRQRQRIIHHRPAWHFCPGNWMNDPIPFFFNGEYHIFYQYNPNGAFWGTMHWGHAVSRDLLHWTTLPPALAPTPGGPDRDGCFTGSVVRDGARFCLLYTGIPRLSPLQQTQCLAVSSDLINWEKYAENPLAVKKPAGFGECFRDPLVWRVPDGWQMLIGGEQSAGKGGAAFLYYSADLIHWEYRQVLFAGDARRSGPDFECPDLFPLGGRQLFLSSRGQSWWHSGSLRDWKFTPRQFGCVDGGALYAARTLIDSTGRRILWGWLRETRPEEEQRAAGWSGVLSLPREVIPAPHGGIGFRPVAELKRLRGRHFHFERFALSPGERQTLEDVTGDSLEIRVKFAAPLPPRAGIILHCRADLSGGSEIFYDHRKQILLTTPLPLPEKTDLLLHIFLDRSVVEIFANQRACHTLRIYPEDADRLHLGVFCQGGPAVIHSIDIWELRPTLTGNEN